MSSSKVIRAGLQLGTGIAILLTCLAGCSLPGNSNDLPASDPISFTESASGTGDSTPQSPTFLSTPLAPIVSPYIDVTVTDIEVIYLDTHPVQVKLIIHGTLPDQCSYEFYSIENRLPGEVKLTLRGIHPSTTDCAQTVQNLTHTVLLGKDFPEAQRGFDPGSYQLMVNGYQTTFMIDP